MKLSLRKYSYRFADQVLNSKLNLKNEIEQILTDPNINISSLSRPAFNKTLRESFILKGWEDQPAVFKEEDSLLAKMDFLKDRIGIEVEFGHASFIGIDLLKFQVSSFSALDQIDVGVYVVVTHDFKKRLEKEFKWKWEGSLSYEKVIRYLPQFKSAIQVPIYVLGIDI